MKKLLAIVPFLLVLSPIFVSAYTISNFDPSDPGDSDTPQAVKGATGTLQNAADPITTTGAGTVSTVSVCVTKNGSPVDNAVLSIYSDSAGAPGSDLGDSTGVAASGITSNGALNDCSSGGASFVTFTFTTPVSLSASTNYWLFLGRSGTRSTSNYYFLDGDSRVSTGFGHMLASNSGTWTSNGAEGFYNLVVTPSGGGGGGGGGNSMYALTLYASSSLASMIGSSPDGVVAWMWAEVGKPILGGAILALEEVIPILVIIGILSVLVFIGYRLWRMWSGN